MQCILGFKGSFPCVKRDKTAAWGGREREREGEAGVSIRSNEEHFLHSSVGITCRHWQTLSEC